MYNVLKFGVSSCLKKINNPSKLLLRPVINFTETTPVYSRPLWHMCSASEVTDFMRPKAVSELCRCGCSGLLHTGGEKNLVEFLQDEIVQERKALKMKSLPSELEGFSITADKAELTFTKKNDLESIKITLNVNHSVDTEEVGEDGNYSEEMKSKPSFEFDEPTDGEKDDIFEITEVTYYEGEWEENTYAVAADLLDENLYDLFMEVLADKGITRKFVEKISEIATSHEHSQYIGLLENLRKFASVN